MLILARNEGEAIVIGDDVVVRVMRVNGGQVKIGVDCPRDIPVHREEIYDRIQNEKAGVK